MHFQHMLHQHATKGYSPYLFFVVTWNSIKIITIFYFYILVQFLPIYHMSKYWLFLKLQPPFIFKLISSDFFNFFKIFQKLKFTKNGIRPFFLSFSIAFSKLSPLSWYCSSTGNFLHLTEAKRVALSNELWAFGTHFYLLMKQFKIMF